MWGVAGGNLNQVASSHRRDATEAGADRGYVIIISATLQVFVSFVFVIFIFKKKCVQCSLLSFVISAIINWSKSSGLPKKKKWIGLGKFSNFVSTKLLISTITLLTVQNIPYFRIRWIDLNTVNVSLRPFVRPSVRPLIPQTSDQTLTSGPFASKPNYWFVRDNKG